MQAKQGISMLKLKSTFLPELNLSIHDRKPIILFLGLFLLHNIFGYQKDNRLTG